MQRGEDFEKLYKEHYVLLSLLAYKLLKDQEAAKDVVHDFFVSFWRKKDNIAITGTFKSYAYKAVKNMCFQHLKKQQKRAKQREKLANSQNEAHMPAENFLLAKGARLMDLLSQLPESRKNIFMDHVVNGLTYREIAEANGISINTVKTQMKRAYSFLREEGNWFMIVGWWNSLPNKPHTFFLWF